MKRVVVCSAAIVLIFTAGCSRSVRYSQDEIKDYPEAVQAHIRKNEVTTGMTRAQVRYAWGGPHEVRILTPAEGGKERVEWMYKKNLLFKTRLIFTDGRVTEIISNEPGTGRQ